CRRRIRPVTIGKILLGHDFVQSLALDHRVAAVLHQVGDEQVGDALAYVNVLAEEGRNTAMDGGVVEVHDRHPLFASLGWGGGAGGRWRLGTSSHDKEKTK